MLNIHPSWLTALLCGFLLFCMEPRRAAGQGTGGAGGKVGIFDGSGDIGTVLHPGGVEYDAAKQSYAISGSGENMWFSADAFQFAWKQVSGDWSLTADVSFVGTGKNPHRKAVLMIRQSLDADSAYADVALHGVGLTSLQYRSEKGATTHEVQANGTAPSRLRIEKHGKYVHMWLAKDGEELKLAGGSGRLEFTEPFYIGLGVCSHDKETTEKAVFSNISLTPIQAGGPTRLYSALETITVASTDRRVVYIAPEHFEAPNWTRDGMLLFNRNGRIVRMPAIGGEQTILDTGFAKACNNDHGLSPDGKWLAISDQSKPPRQSRIYIVPIGGGKPRLLTEKSPSYWHGWSPDGLTLAYAAQRSGKFDIYSMPAAGGEETRLTTAPGLSDGPEYSPDGQYIYFNSDRTGLMQIWRMKPDGSGEEQVTHDELNNWFAHFSPNGQSMVFVSYEKEVAGHPANKDVTIRLMKLADAKVTVLASLFGGQGTMNVPSWSPDGKQVAFVSYVLAAAN